VCPDPVTDRRHHPGGNVADLDVARVGNTAQDLKRRFLAAAVLGHDDAHRNIHDRPGLQRGLEIPCPVQVAVDPQRQPQGPRGFCGCPFNYPQHPGLEQVRPGRESADGSARSSLQGQRNGGQAADTVPGTAAGKSVPAPFRPGVRDHHGHAGGDGLRTGA